jgi:AcrR family transcriptional regulator
MSSEKNPTRERILDSTLQLLETGGGSQVRMSDIARQAGVSRQAVYLHYPGRAELLVAATRHLDGKLKIHDQLARCRALQGDPARLDAWIEVWGNYIPGIYGVAKALLAMKDTDEEARTAWNDRMLAMREGCAAAVDALDSAGKLNPALDRTQASDLLWALLSVRTWEQLRLECGWSQQQYIDKMKQAAASILMAD